MTQLAPEPMNCAVCGGASVRVLLASSNAMEPPDFDTRPGEMLRSTLPYWVMDCPHCGYAASDIREADTRAIAYIRGEDFHRRLAAAAPPEEVRRFAAYALLLEHLEQFADAGWAWLHAAWMGDDEQHAEAARACRSEAIRLWKRGKAAGEDFMEDHPQEFALVTDVLRRLGDFDAAREACLEALTLDGIPPVVEDMLRRQLSLIQQKDTAAHSLKELERPQRGERVTLN
jgi:tetratricopeptide (TPR) repeat protein